MVSPDARNTAWVSFDGRKRQELCHGDRYQNDFFFSAILCVIVSDLQRMRFGIIIII